jgi:hypothetical protein
MRVKIREVECLLSSRTGKPIYVQSFRVTRSPLHAFSIKAFFRDVQFMFAVCSTNL